MVFALSRYLPPKPKRIESRWGRCGLRNVNEGVEEGYVLADQEHVDGAEVELVEVGQSCDSISA